MAFEEGGNALDACLSACLSLAVTYPDNCALGGDLLALVSRADGSRVVINASGPAALDIDAERLVDGGGQMATRGADTVTVPGLVGGLAELWKCGALLEWDAAFDAAIRQARDGVPVVPTLASSITREASTLQQDPGCREVFFAGDRPLRHGDTLRQPALAETLQRLATVGPDEFYRGRIGRTLIGFLRSQGSRLSTSDLARFSPERCNPEVRTVDGREIATAPPNSQGFLLPLILSAAFNLDEELDPLGPKAGELATIFSAALAVREDRLADPRSSSLQRDFDPSTVELTTDGIRPIHQFPPATGDTVAVVAADDAGNCVSLLQSVFHSFGSGLLDPETGILLHNRGAGFSLDPRSPNVIAGGKRPAHTLTPCMVFKDGRPEIVIATMGGSVQPQILAEILLRLRLGDRPLEAVTAPRWVIGGFGVPDGAAQILVEEGVPAAAQDSLRRLPTPVRVLPHFDGNVGHSQLIVPRANGQFEVASDPRSEGAAIVAERRGNP